MFRFLLLAFIVVPIAELYLIFQVGSVIGGWETFGLLILDSIIGAWLVRREGFSILAKVQGSLTNGEAPTNSIIDGLLVLVAGALMLTPGFLTDGVGLVFLLPPSRAVVRTWLKARFAGRINVGGGAYSTSFGGFTDVGGSDSTVYDTDPDPDPPGPIELGPTSE